MSFVITQAPSQGTVKFNGNFAVYTANAGSSGTDTYSVEAFEQLEYSSPMVVTVTITAASSIPPATPPPSRSSPGGGSGGTLDPWGLGALLSILGWQFTLLRRRLLAG